MGRMEDGAREENMLSALASRGRYTKADVESLCQIAVAGALKGAALQRSAAVAAERKRCAKVCRVLEATGTEPTGEVCALAIEALGLNV